MEDIVNHYETLDLLELYIENGLLPGTRAKINGTLEMEEDKVTKYECVLSDMLDYLLTTKNSGKLDYTYQKNGEVKREIQKDDNINDAMRIFNGTISTKNLTGTKLFYSILGDATTKLGKYRIKDLMLNEILLPLEEFMVLNLLKRLMDIIVVNGIKRLENESDVRMRLGMKWVDKLQLDAELRHLMHYGSVSGLYNRIKYLTECSSTERNGRLDSSIARLTLVNELPNLKGSRQVVFGRILSFVSKCVIKGGNEGPILDLLCNCIVDSGVKEFLHDDPNLVYRLLRMGKTAKKICPTLKLGTEVYTNNECDFEDLRAEVSCIYYGNSIGIAEPDYIFRLNGAMILDKGVV